LFSSFPSSNQKESSFKLVSCTVTRRIGYLRIRSPGKASQWEGMNDKTTAFLSLHAMEICIAELYTYLLCKHPDRVMQHLRKHTMLLSTQQARIWKGSRADRLRILPMMHLTSWQPRLWHRRSYTSFSCFRYSRVTAQRVGTPDRKDCVTMVNLAVLFP